MQKYYAIQRGINGNWNNEPIIKYRASEIEILQKVTEYQNNTPTKNMYVVKYLDLVNDYDNTATVSQIYNSHNEAKSKAQELNLKILTQHKNSPLNDLVQ